MEHSISIAVITAALYTCPCEENLLLNRGGTAPSDNSRPVGSSGAGRESEGIFRATRPSEREVGTPTAVRLHDFADGRGFAYPCKGAKRLASECEREGEAPSALPMEGATRAPVMFC